MDDYILKKCEFCNSDMMLKINKNKKSINYGKIIKIHKNKKFCSKECQIEWQKTISWEERVGKETAEKIRKESSLRVSGENNPTKNKDVAKKVSESLKIYFKYNPRYDEKNPFYGKKHTDEYKNISSEKRKGKRSYDENGYNKLLLNTPKNESHPNWNGGTSNGSYPFEFSKKLKNKIKERDNHKCMICEKKTQKIAIHHIDYDKSNTNENNLISLCYSCHSMTNYNRENWELFLKEKLKNK